MSATPAVGIVGAGFGGLAAALELKGAGIDSFTVLEREGEVGGVWQANTYPGAACDVPSVIYQFSRHLKPNWSRRFGRQAEIRDYLREVSIETGVREHIRFHTEVVAATFVERAAVWQVETADGQTLSFDVLICATGQLSRPRLPELGAPEAFQGAQFHSAEWDHSVELAGRRVVVVRVALSPGAATDGPAAARVGGPPASFDPQGGQRPGEGGRGDARLRARL